ncbi:flagellar hook protein FlgE [Iodidimonas sp. SYSU 1G8]|uniref:flagellar hook protein FlgE n=1 Tax=Iodidimonas sp. SYSU 1G8 TaxID=3133967 RepID=UPI0031FE6432
MSLYSALYAGVSGLGAQSSAMAGVADNIANINTVGYKGVQTEFKSLVVDGQASSSYTAGGVAASPQMLISKQGLLQTSSNQTDMGIDGSGFFVVRSTEAPDSTVSFTRAGSFSPDAEGFLRNTSGYYLQGWPLDGAGGYVNTGNLDELQPVGLGDLNGTATATTAITIRANLQSTTPVQTAAYAVGDLASGTMVPDFTRSLDIFDAQGGSHRVTMGFAKTGVNQWAGEIYADPATDVTAAGGLLASGAIAFNADGSLDLAGSTGTLFSPLSVTWTNGAGSSPIALNLGSDAAVNGLTQFGGESALLSSSLDGGLLNNIASIDISKTGLVSAIFDDGTSRAVFQLPLATFANPDGLTRLSGNAYSISNESGSPTINPPGSFGSGSIVSSALEASNVDLAQEFTNMIRFQRAYSASSKVITTVDDMLQEVNNLKR